MPTEAEIRAENESTSALKHLKDRPIRKPNKST